MRWLIVEDALKDRQGHWLEWVTTFDRGFRDLGDSVAVLADARVDPDIRQSLRAEAILPHSIWHRLGDGAGPLTRYGRVFGHNWQTWRVMNRYLRDHPEFDAIFVPTVSVHHLLAWTQLIKRTLRDRNTRVLLFFLTAPMNFDAVGQPVWERSPTARLLAALLSWLAPEVTSGKVVLGVETREMRAAFSKLANLPFTWFPQPVAPASVAATRAGDGIEMACFGAARAEKGSDILLEAIRQHRRTRPSSGARFTIQWIEDFTTAGRLITKSSELLSDPQVRFVTNYFAAGEYAAWLRRTDVMLLPYRRSSYALRGSRVVIEAAVGGIPVVVTRGTTLAGVVQQWGTGIECEDGDPQSLANAIAQMEARFETMRERAAKASGHAAKLYSVAEFRRAFVASASPQPAQRVAATTSTRAGAMSPLMIDES